ncbi:MAG: tetraacyldisaccharide 4'-kinase [Myxococcaceae bacterium]|nr:tetraacyldisaccharide 4'-kinase [Myxococcaceae bacterium]
MSRYWERRWYGGEGGGWLGLPLRAAAAGFGAAVAVRSLFVRPRVVEGARVVSVGNLTVGGSGKTPVVIFLSQWAASAGRRVAVLSRGYGRTSRADVRFDAANLLPASEIGDEPRLIAQRCPAVTVWVGRDRARLAVAARDAGADFLVLDDGMQHRRLARDVDLVVVDAAAGFGNGRLLPAGPLREPVTQLSRASLVWLRQTAETAPGLEAQLGPTPRVVSRPVAHVVDGTIRGKRVVALAGLARPSAFTRTLVSLGAEVVAERYFPDHHTFTDAELDEVRSLGAVVVTTEKDAQRLKRGFPALVVRLDEELVSGRELLAEQLRL